MTENGLYGRFPDPPPDQLSGEPMAEGMRRYLTLNSDCRAQLRDDVLHRSRADLLARLPDLVPTGERGQRPGAANQVAASVPVGDKRVGGRDVEMHGSALAALGPVDVGLAIVQRNVSSPQGAQLRDAHTGSEHEQDHRLYLQTTEVQAVSYTHLRAHET